MPISLQKVEAKEIVVGIVGLGYVGFPLSLTFAGADVPVLGFDVDAEKVELINAGRSYFHHIPPECFRHYVDQKLFSATDDFSRVAECDVIIICVPTPLDAHREPDLRFVKETCETIAPHLQPKTLVALESTTWPGTTDEVCRPILESRSGYETGIDLFLAYSPEREDPGNVDFGTKNIPKLVGADSKESLDLAVAVYSLALEQVIPLSSSRIAESAKLFENIFRSVNIALVNELKVIFDKMDIDVWEVIQAAGTKPFGFMPFWPGPGLGGHCIPIDPFYLTWKAREYGINTRFIELAGEINRSMPDWVVDKVQDCLNSYGKALRGSRILILGLAYKADIDDMRESPSLQLIRLLENKGATVDYHDPFIKKIGNNREFTELIGRRCAEITPDYDCFVVATKHSMYQKENILSHGVPVVDTRNLLPRHKLVYSA